MNYEISYADTDEAIAKASAELNRAADRGEVAGLDTEFFGVDLRRHSTVAKSKLHFLSTSVRRRPNVLIPRGYHIADATVFPRTAIEHVDLRRWLENADAKKAVHNLPVDAHTLHNEGVKLGGGLNTLALSRWAWPGRARGPGFTLDSLGQDLCGEGKLVDYQELFRETIEVITSKTRKVRVCACGAVAPTRKHPRGVGHERDTIAQEIRGVKVQTIEVPLELVVPGHKLFQQALRYAAQDAVLALAIYELATREIDRRMIDVPWL